MEQDRSGQGRGRNIGLSAGRLNLMSNEPMQRRSAGDWVSNTPAGDKPWA
jgi:hypothetical protein